MSGKTTRKATTSVSASKQCDNGKAVGQAAEPAKPALPSITTLDERLARIEAALDELKQAVLHQPADKDYYTPAEVAKLERKKPYTVREWCRWNRINAQKGVRGRGGEGEWRISHEELTRYRNEGLLPLRSSKD